MSVARITITVCDRCESTEGLVAYDVKRDGGRVKVDLCRNHAAELEELIRPLGEASPVPRKRTTKKVAAARGSRAGRVTTMDEIERLKTR